MKTMIALGAGLFLAGCATATEIPGPDGRIGYFIRCDGMAAHWGMCFEKAAKECPSGYVVFDRQEQALPTVYTMYGPAQRIDRNMMIQCEG